VAVLTLLCAAEGELAAASDLAERVPGPAPATDSGGGGGGGDLGVIRCVVG
jgi:hypothetical protein